MLIDNPTQKGWGFSHFRVIIDKCPDNCASCDASGCLSCEPIFSLLAKNNTYEGYFLYNKVCIETCPIDTFPVFSSIPYCKKMVASDYIELARDLYPNGFTSSMGWSGSFSIGTCAGTTYYGFITTDETSKTYTNIIPHHSIKVVAKVILIDNFDF
jgi:hypothetical protein